MIEVSRRRAARESSNAMTFDRFHIRSLTPPQAAGIALAVSVHENFRTSVVKIFPDYSGQYRI
jgi:hypothetical protein